MNLSARDLYEKIFEYRGGNLFDEVLLNWVEISKYKDFLLSVEDELVSLSKTLFTEEISWELYALSRVFDILNLRFQTNNNKDGSDWLGPEITLNEYCEFAKKLGCKIIEPKTYTPFYCEIIEAKEDRNDFNVIKIVSPTIMLKNLILKKGGIIIGLNPKNYNVSLVSNSTLYWAFRRKNRNYRDLSQGWGHNSQWRTHFRFDLETEDSFIYNFNGKFELNLPDKNLERELEEQNLNLNEAIELTKNRHFMTSIKDDKDLFPYEFKYLEKKNTHNTIS